jgi:hypothetical protein
MGELRDQARSKDANLEDIFLKLAGGEEVKDLIRGLRGWRRAKLAKNLWLYHSERIVSPFWIGQVIRDN